ncbi:B- and T-lymphocyte attenuator isoform X2 [Simochromis diagramma]|uniref:B- and T-lymphocyte attenuator isoform X2 n=1 Tax=Simochromis diagramma TaxID=43689 RepID=UPI001A7E5EA3|nr:B- and T-lymphocyte attenuator isoform X2 [Simochromis diagramma]
MLSLKDKLNYLIIFCCCVFVSVHGSGKGLHASCDVAIMVRRDSTRKTPPRRSLTVSCPVIHCGETLEVTWCKLFDSNNCERIHETKNVKITQDPDKDKLISYLNFKEISIHDDGMYRCGLLGYNVSAISHSISISVSDMYQGIETPDNNDKNAGTTPSPDHNENWRPYFYIYFGIVLLILILTTLIFRSSYDWKRALPSSAAQPCSNQISASNPALKYQQCAVYGIINHRHATKQGGKYHNMTNPESSFTAERPESLTCQPHEHQISASNPALKYQQCAVYGIINHRHTTKQGLKYHAVTNQVKNPEFSFTAEKPESPAHQPHEYQISA